VTKTNNRNQIGFTSVWAGLLILSGLAPLCADANERLDLSVRIVGDDLLSLSVQHVPVRDVLQEIARTTDLKVVQFVAIDRLVTLSLERQPLSIVLDHILEGDSYQLYERQQEAADILWIFSEGSSLAPAATVYSEGLLFQGNVDERKEAIMVLQELGTPDAVRSLSLALADENTGVRNLAFDALAVINGEEALAAIASASMDLDPRVRGEAALALASSDSESAVQYLSIAYSDPNPIVRRSAVEGFADIPSKQSVRALGFALHDESPEVRMQAVDALENIGGDTVLQVLLDARADSNPAVRDAVSDALLLLDRGQ